ncbi:unnamed protein product [Paramecium primaurelia]|uniref:Uncharacterized protein n=1 Tax=Paramecium primaurelia TaxID=5886 RepID=A0A8S1JZR6_PARPR|nr:unnamed protein product [Paramecium primaurelia]
MINTMFKHDKKCLLFEIFEVITAQQLTVEKIQIINADLIVGFSKSEQHVKIWSISKRQAVFEHFFDQKKVNELLIIQNLNDLVAYGFLDKQVQIWSIETQCGFSMLYELSYEQQIKKIKLSNNTTQIGILHNDQQIRQLSKDQLQQTILYESNQQVEDYCFFKKQTFLAIIQKRGFVLIFSIKSQKSIKQWNANQQGQLSIDGIDKDLIIVTQARDYSIKIWNMSSYHLLRVIDSRKISLSSYDIYNNTLLMSTFKPSLDIISLKTCKMIQSLEVDYPILKIEIESESNLIAILDYEFQIILIRKKKY